MHLKGWADEQHQGVEGEGQGGLGRLHFKRKVYKNLDEGDIKCFQILSLVKIKAQLFFIQESIQGTPADGSFT